jgi:hypothetical protein
VSEHLGNGNIFRTVTAQNNDKFMSQGKAYEWAEERKGGLTNVADYERSERPSYVACVSS